MEIRSYLATLWRRKWMIVVTAAVTTAIVAAGTWMMTPKYEATTTLRVVPASDTSTNERLGGYDPQYGDRLMNTYSEIVKSAPVMANLTQQLNLEQPPLVKVEIPANTELMRIVVEYSNPKVTATAANTLAKILMTQASTSHPSEEKTAQDILGEQLARLEIELNQARETYEHLIANSPATSERIESAHRTIEMKRETYAILLEQYERARFANAMRANSITVVEPAVEPQMPSKPHWGINLALGFLMGLVGGLSLALLLNSPASPRVINATRLVPAADAVALIIRRTWTPQETFAAARQQLNAGKTRATGQVVYDDAESDKEFDTHYPAVHLATTTKTAATQRIAQPTLQSRLPANFPNARSIIIVLVLSTVALVDLVGYLQLSPAGALPPSNDASAKAVPSPTRNETATGRAQAQIKATLVVGSISATVVEATSQGTSRVKNRATIIDPGDHQMTPTRSMKIVTPTKISLSHPITSLNPETRETPTVVPALTPTNTSILPSRTPTPAPTQTPTDTPAVPSTVTSKPSPTPPRATSQPVTHLVAEGDTPQSIAYEHGVKVEDLMAANGIDGPASLRIGQKLLIPMVGAPTGRPSPSPSPTWPLATQASIALLTASSPSNSNNPTGAFTLLAPSPFDYDYPSHGPTDFEWIWDGPLPPELGFEVRVWREGEPRAGVHDAVLDNRKGRIEKIGENKYRLTVDIKDILGPHGVYPRPSGEYLWTVGLVMIQSEYAELDERYWAEPTHFRFEAPDGGGGSGNNGGGR